MKPLLLSVFILFMNLTLSSQNMQFGVKAGVNFASLTGDDVENADSKTSFHAGVLAEISFSEKFSIQPELLFSAQGVSENYENAELKLNYLQLPIMAKYYIIEDLSLEFGPQIGILLSADAKVEGESEGDIKEFMNDLDFGLNLGASYKFGDRLFVSARYNLGLSKVFKSVTFFEEELEIKAYNSVIQLSLGYLFN